MTPDIQGQRIHPPLHMLFLSPLNARKNDTSDVTELKGLIRAQKGLLQNLIVVPKVEGGQTVGYGVVGGGRRYRALTELVADGEFPTDYPTPCLAVAEEDAELASVAENSGREQMHPADEFEAFQRFHAAGMPIEDIAARHGVSPLVVRRRLKLANVSPMMIAAYRSGKINLDQLMALAVTDDHELQERTWENATSWNRRPETLRAALMQGTVHSDDNRVAKFIGIEAYEAAGGTVVRDLFAGENEGYMTDGDLLDKLFADRMVAEVEKLQAEGWSWVESKESIGFGDIYNFNRSKPTKRDLTPEEQAEIDSIKAQIAALRQRDMLDVDDEDDEDDYNYDEAAEEAITSQIAALEAKADAIQEQTLSYSTNQKKKAGAMVGLNHAGQLTIYRGLIRAVTKTEAKSKGGEGSSDEPAGPAHPESLTRKLSAHRTAALQASLIDNHKLALATLCYTLASQVLYSGGHYGLGSIRISANQQFTGLKHHADDIEGSKAWGEMIEQREALRTIMPENPAELFSWLREQNPGVITSILAYCTAACVDAVQHNEGTRQAADLADAVGLDMADWWEPTVAGYFKHLRKDSAIAVMAEAGIGHHKEKLANMKKADLDAHVAKAIAGANWLPQLLREPAAGPKEDAKPKATAGTVKLTPEAAWPFPLEKKGA